MRLLLLAALLFPLAGLPASAQPMKKRNDADFLKDKPTIGELIPDLTVYDPSGKEVKTSSLRGHYTVLTFGCLT